MSGLKNDLQKFSFYSPLSSLCTYCFHLCVAAMVFAIGLSSGVIENFAYQRLRDLGAGGEVMGVSRLISSFAGEKCNMYCYYPYFTLIMREMCALPYPFMVAVVCVRE